jgi:hypothetical protein
MENEEWKATYVPGSGKVREGLKWREIFGKYTA